MIDPIYMFENINVSNSYLGYYQSRLQEKRRVNILSEKIKGYTK